MALTLAVLIGCGVWLLCAALIGRVLLKGWDE